MPYAEAGAAFEEECFTMEDWAIVALGVPVGLTGIFFGWLSLRQYLKILGQRERLNLQALELQERELTLNEKKVDHDIVLQEKELEYKFKMLEWESQKKRE